MLLVVLFETIEIFGRLVFGSAKDGYARKLGFTIHTSYVGVTFSIIYFLFSGDVFFIFGLALIIQDVIHHLVILPVLVGRNEFP